MEYRIGPSGATGMGPIYLYGYSFAVDEHQDCQKRRFAEQS